MNFFGATLDAGVIQEPACVRLEFENRPQNVALVRAVLTGLAEAAEFDEEFATDVKTAVSEACNNVVLHAYDGGSGAVYVTVRYVGDRVDVVVTDHGTGIRRLSSAPDHMGLGLPLISALADQAEFRSPTDGGTEVRMRFRRSELASEAGIPQDGEWAVAEHALDGDVVLWCEPVSLLRHVLGRAARAVASSAHFTIAGAAELHAINDAVAQYAEAVGDHHVVVALTARSHELELDLGPLWAEDGVGADGAATLAPLVDELSFQSMDGDSSKLLHLLLLDRGQTPID
jgi:serine/threonine-protein kinase RsbW